MGYIVVARCKGGHVQEMEIDDMLGIDWAMEYEAMLDGTSSLFLKRPEDTGSVIGRCASCGETITCSVEAHERHQEA